jgi:hypothetical protein
MNLILTKKNKTKMKTVKKEFTSTLALQVLKKDIDFKKGLQDFINKSVQCGYHSKVINNYARKWGRVAARLEPKKLYVIFDNKGYWKTMTTKKPKSNYQTIKPIYS